MAPETMVVEDGVEDTRSRSPKKPPWILVVVGFALGLVLGSLISLPEGTADAEPTPTTVVVAEEPAPVDSPLLPAEDGVTSIIPEFPNAIVGVGVGADGGLDHLLWPARNPLVVNGIVSGSDVRFDATGQFVALSETVPGLPGVLLSMGRVTAIRPVISGVTSYAWHDSMSGELAFTTEQDGRWLLYEASRTLVPDLVVEGGYEGGTLIGWGDWGYAVQTGEGDVALLNRDGEFKDIEVGQGLATHPSGWVFVVDDDLKLVSAGGGVERVLAADTLPRPVVAASFSPDGSKVAMAGTFGVKMLDVEQRELTDFSPVFPSDWVSWSSDNRFLMSPASSGAYVHDLETGVTTLILVDHSVVALAVLPVAAS